MATFELIHGEAEIEQGIERMKKIFPEAVRAQGMSCWKVNSGSIVVTWKRIVHTTRCKTSPLVALGGTLMTKSIH